LSANLSQHRVPFFRIDLDDADVQAVVSVLRSGWLTTGPETEAFEREFADFIGGGVEAVAVNSNTAGLHLSLEALGVGPGDEVIVPTLTFTATAEVVRYMGADVVFADVDPKTYCVTADEISRKITPKTKAVIPVHFGGLSCDLKEIASVTEPAGVFIVEDAAHALPTTFDGKLVGSHGSKSAVFSFYANKTLTTGEGGMVVSTDRQLIARARIMRTHGIDRDSFRRFTSAAMQWNYDVVAPGYKYNLTDIAAALGRSQLRRVHELREARERIVERYNEAFGELPVALPCPPRSREVHSWHLYPIAVEADARIRREGLISVLEAHRVGYSVHYTPLHRMTYWKERYRLHDGEFPVAADYADRCVSLPLFPGMTEQDIDQVIAAVRTAFGRNR